MCPGATESRFIAEMHIGRRDEIGRPIYHGDVLSFITTKREEWQGTDQVHPDEELRRIFVVNERNMNAVDDGPLHEMGESGVTDDSGDWMDELAGVRIIGNVNLHPYYRIFDVWHRQRLPDGTEIDTCMQGSEIYRREPDGSESWMVYCLAGERGFHTWEWTRKNGVDTWRRYEPENLDAAKTLEDIENLHYNEVVWHDISDAEMMEIFLHSVQIREEAWESNDVPWKYKDLRAEGCRAELEAWDKEIDMYEVECEAQLALRCRIGPIDGIQN
jgi:hypothetical protein